MTSIKDKPSASQQDPAEGSREVIERELLRKGPEKEAGRKRDKGQAPGVKVRESKKRQSK